MELVAHDRQAGDWLVICRLVFDWKAVDWLMIDRSVIFLSLLGRNFSIYRNASFKLTLPLTVHGHFADRKFAHGRFADRQFVDRQFADWTVCRQDGSPTGELAIRMKVCTTSKLKLY